MITALAIVSGIVALAIIFVLHMIVKRIQMLKNVQLTLNKRQQKFKLEIRQYISSLTGLGNRILDLENRLDLLTEKLSQLNFNDNRNQTFKQATKVAELGGTADDVKECGLTQAEANLISILKKK